MVQQGLVEYDVLPDKVYIRLKVIPVGPKARKEHKRAKEKEERRRDGQDKKDDYSYM
jgi:hypothetical protein